VSVFIYNEMTGRYNECDELVVRAYTNWKTWEQYWLDYARNYHNHSSMMSALVLVGLQKKMDEAWLAFKPFANLWMIAAKGLSLN